MSLTDHDVSVFCSFGLVVFFSLSSKTPQRVPSDNDSGQCKDVCTRDSFILSNFFSIIPSIQWNRKYRK